MPVQATHRYRPRGNCRTLLRSRDAEVLLSGPAGTGKSRACLEKLHLLALANPGMRGLICRKTATSLSSTALATWTKFVIPEAEASETVRYFGGSAAKPAAYIYKNGSQILVGGLDKVSKIMSSEYDCVVGETLVDSPSEIQRAYGRPYSGQLVTITTASGKKLTGTPNHPILTDRGWIGLGLLSEGGYVLSRCHAEDPRRDVTSLVHPDVAQEPSTIADVVRTLSQSDSRLAVTERAETVPMDFHGDGAYG